MEGKATYYNDSEGDIYFITTDDVTFKASRRFLSYASQVFRDMFQAGHLPDGSNEGSESVPIKIDASSAVFDAVMRLIYPVLPPDFSDARTGHHLPEVIIFCMKYMLEDVILRLRKELVRSEYIEKFPLRAYFVACKWDWKEEEICAIKAAVQYHDFSAIIQSTPEMDDIPSSKYHKLLNLNRAFREVLKSCLRSSLAGLVAAAEYDDSEEQYDLWAPRCICNPSMHWVDPDNPTMPGYFTQAPPKWFRLFMTKATIRLQHGTLPVHDLASLEFLHQIGSESHCTGCAGNMLAHWSRIQSLPEMVLEQVDELNRWKTNERLANFLESRSIPY